MVLCIVQWYYVLQHYSVASRSTAYSTLVLWQLPVALHIVRWVLLTVVQLPCSNVLQFVLMPTLSLGMVLLNPYISRAASRPPKIRLTLWAGQERIGLARLITGHGRAETS